MARREVGDGMVGDGDDMVGVDGSGWVRAVQGKKKKIDPVGLVLHAIK
jgi:hypothetical protein